MKNKFGICLIIVLISTSLFIVKAEPLESKTIYVDDIPGEGENNPPEDYTNIQEAIAEANDGDTIFVYSGTYYECVTIDKKLTINGENKETTITDGLGCGDGIYGVVTFLADSTTISDFTIRNSGMSWSNSGIFIGTYGTTIGANNSIIQNNIIEDNFNGIWLMNSHHCIILDNSLKDNQNTGITVYGGDNNIVKDNIIESNDFGIVVAGFYNEIQLNDIINNARTGLFIGRNDEYKHNIISQNNFMENDENAHDFKYNFFSKGNTWNNNYWDKKRFLPYFIPCDIKISDYFFHIPWFVIDINPARTPF